VFGINVCRLVLFFCVEKKFLNGDFLFNKNSNLAM
jgi:hypothetical protein